MEEQWHSRTEILFGIAGIKQLARANVAVFGLGGVGSYAAEALCRAGVGRMTIVDYDVICPSNINRQLHALTTTLGRAKVQVMADRFRLINPTLQIVPFQDFYTADTSELLLGEPYDMVIDAIDNITSKLHLLTICRQRGLEIISSMGAAMKSDPTRIRVADIGSSHTCRMARIMRKLLKKRGITEGITVVFSTEERLQSTGESALPDDQAIGQGAHQRPTLGSCSFIPGIFGLTMAGIAVQRIIAKNLADAS